MAQPAALTHLTRAWDGTATWLDQASLTSTISRECASMVIMFMTFMRSVLGRSVRVTSISFVSCLTCEERHFGDTLEHL